MWSGLALAVLGVGLGFALRVTLLASLENRSPFITFYLLVVLVSLYGGLVPGVAVTLLSAVAASYWMERGNWPALMNAADWVRMGFFVASGVVVAAVCEAMHRANERLQRERAQAKHRDDLEVVFNSISDPVWYVDERMRLTYANAAAVRAFGINSADGADLETFLHTIEVDTQRGGITAAQTSVTLQALKGEAVRDFALRIRMPGKEDLRDCLLDVSPVRDEGGAVVGAITLVHDITRLKQAEAELRQKEAEAKARADEFEAIVDAVPAFVFVARDPDCRYMDSSRRTRELLRLPNGSNVSKSAPPPDVPSTYKVLKNGRELAVTELPLQQAASTGQPVRDVEFSLQFADGASRDIYGDAVPLFDSAGKVRGAIGAFLDITARKIAEESLRESEARLQIFIEHAPAALAMFDREMRYLSASRRWCTDLGLEPQDLRGRLHYEVFPEVPPRWKELHRRGMTGEVLSAEEDASTRSDGSVQWVKWELRPWRGAGGEVGGIVIFIEDITQRKEAEAKLQAATTTAERANRAKDHFLAVLSHELRTPLTPALATLSLLQSEAQLDGGVQEMLEVVRRNCELEALLIDDLLDVTRIAQGKMQLQRQPVELGQVLQHAADVCGSDLQARRVTLEMSVDESKCVVEGDPLRLQQVFWNLIKNSVKFTEPGGTIRVSCECHGQQYTVVVKDTGLGIEPAMLPRIFNAFEQAGLGSTRQFGGLGLGLTISKAMVELHGGTIEAHSDGRGRGATFTVRLPAMTGGAAAVAAKDAAAEAPGLRILLVEDHGDTARVLAKLLARKGHTVTVAGDVATGLRMFEEKEFDLLLSDLGLPDGSGTDLMKAIRSRDGRLPAVALSGYGQPQDVERSKAAGFAMHLTKPTSAERLYAAIGTVWQGRDKGDAAV